MLRRLGVLDAFSACDGFIGKYSYIHLYLSTVLILSMRNSSSSAGKSLQ